MKYIELFEIKKREGQKMYWLLPTDNRFEMSLNEIGAPKAFINTMLHTVFAYHKDCKYAFIAFDGRFKSKHTTSRWGWNRYQGHLYDKLYREDGFRFCGLVNMNELELEAEKYNL